MSKLKDYLAPISTVLINGVLAYFINQLPGIRPDPDKGITGFSDTSIFLFTAIFTAVLCILTFLEKDSAQKSTGSNINSQSQNIKSNWIGGFLLFLVGAVIYGLLQVNIIPQESRTEFGNISLILCGFGAIIPSFLLIPKRWQNILLLLCSGIGVFLTFHYFRVANLNSAFISFNFTLISIILLAARDFLVKVIKVLAVSWGDLQSQQADEVIEIVKSKSEDLASPFKRNYYKALEYKCRDDETKGLDNEFTLELKKVFVPLKIAANHASNAKQDIIPIARNQSSEITIWDFLGVKETLK